MKKLDMIRNREHFSIDYAAELLDCSSDDIEHFLEIGTIGAYLNLTQYESKGVIAFKQSEHTNIEYANQPDRLVETLVNTDCSWISYIEVVNYDQGVFMTVRGRLDGLWHLDFQTTRFILARLPISNPRLMPAQHNQRPDSELKSSLPLIGGFEAPNEIEKNDIRIVAHELLQLYESLNTNKGSLPNIYSRNQQNVEAQVESKIPRIEIGQSDMISALLYLLPDLKAQLDNKPTNAPEIIDNYFESRGLPPVRVGRNTYANWMKREKYSKKVEQQKTKFAEKKQS